MHIRAGLLGQFATASFSVRNPDNLTGFLR